MSELENEIKSDKEFIEKVADRIYKDTDDWEETIAEPEWIDRMTEIADRYIERFEVTRKLADKWLQSKQVELNDNQQIVLDWLKWDFNKNKVKAMECIYRVVYGENILDMVLLAYIALDNKHQVQVLEVFARWAQEQEGETE